MDRILAFVTMVGMLTGGMCTAWFIHGKTDFFWSWTAAGAVGGLFFGMGLARGAKALIYRYFEDQWPTFF